MGSSGRSSGGGGATTDYPEYQKVIQADWLGGGSYDQPGSMTALGEGKDITALLNWAMDNSPYEGASAYDPSTQVNYLLNAVKEYLPRLDMEIDAYLTYIDSYLSDLTSGDVVADAETLLADTSMETYLDNYGTDSALAQLLIVPEDLKDNISPEIYYTDGSLDQALAYIRGMDSTEQVENELSQFNSNMREINAVHSSAFAIGTQIVASGLLATKAQLHNDIAKARSDKMYNYVQLKAQTESKIADVQLQIAQLRDEKARALMQKRVDSIMALAQLSQQKQQTIADTGTKAHSQVFQSVTNAAEVRSKLMIEARRMAIVAFKEQAGENFRLGAKDALWEIETFQGAANVMASIAGGTVTTTEETAGTGGALGGALSGAAAGASIGTSVMPGWGTAIGAAVGGIGGAIASN